MIDYRAKAKDSFETRLRLFKFHCILYNKEFNLENFLQFRLIEHQKLIDVFTTQYYQWLGSDLLEDVPCEMKISEIHTKMLELKLDKLKSDEWFEKYFNQEFVINFSLDDFAKVVNAKKCYYCHISTSEIENLANEKKLHKKNERGWVMEIDRKKPNLEYTTDNCVPACYWCNNAKTDEFDDIEFEPIGRLIGETLRKRLEK